MNIYDLGAAALLGIVEGVTEFLPISSTGHLILLVDLLGFRGPPGRVLEVVIQFGAILGVCWVYRDRLLNLATDPVSPSNRHILLLLFLSFLPAAAIGFLAHDFIKTTLFNPWVVCVALILGGVAIILIEGVVGEGPIKTLEQVSRRTGSQIGLCQAVSMIPGTSRSAATILGARLLGLSRGIAAEYSFLLAIPTMLAASGYDLFKTANQIDGRGIALLAVGFGAAFITAILTVRWLIAFVSSHSFSVFGWYRIALGSLMLAMLFHRSTA